MTLELAHTAFGESGRAVVIMHGLFGAARNWTSIAKRLAQDHDGEDRCGPLMRKFGIKYAAGHPQHELVRESFAKVRCLADWQAVLARWYGEDLPGVYPDPAIHRATTECEAA